MADGTQDLDVGLIVASAGFGTSGPLIEASSSVEIEMSNLNCTALLASTWIFAQVMKGMTARQQSAVLLIQ